MSSCLLVSAEIIVTNHLKILFLSRNNVEFYMQSFQGMLYFRMYALFVLTNN